MIAAVTAIACSIINRKTLISLLKNLKQHDKFMKRNFELSFDKKKFSSKISKHFMIFFLENFAGHLYLTINIHLYFPNFIYVAWSMAAVNQLSYVQSFQIYTFLKAAEERLKLMEQVDMNRSNVFGIDDTLLNFKKALLQFHEIIHQIQDFFNPSLYTLLLLLYFIVLNNFYWCGLWFLGITFADIKDVLIIITPSFITLIAFALSERNSRKIIKNISSKLLELSPGLSQNKETLILLFRSSFSVSSTGFTTIGEVIKFRINCKTFFNFKIDFRLPIQFLIFL